MTDGIGLTSGMIGIVFKAMLTGSVDDEENMGDVVVNHYRKCNGIDTIQGTFMANYFVNRAT